MIPCHPKTPKNHDYKGAPTLPRSRRQPPDESITLSDPDSKAIEDPLFDGGQQIENPDTQRHVEGHEIHETDDRTVQIKLYSREPAGHLNRIVIGNLRDKVVEITKDVPQNNA